LTLDFSSGRYIYAIVYHDLENIFKGCPIFIFSTNVGKDTDVSFRVTPVTGGFVSLHAVLSELDHASNLAATAMDPASRDASNLSVSDLRL
jgi:hypothetical protein